MRGGLPPCQESGRAEDKGAGTDRGDVLGSGRLSAQEIQRRRIFHHLINAPAARYTDQIQLRTVVKGRVSQDEGTAVGPDRTRGAGDEVDRDPRKPVEHLEWTGEIELGQVIKQKEADTAQSGHGHLRSECRDTRPGTTRKT